jgi:hypothetical protein
MNACRPAASPSAADLNQHHEMISGGTQHIEMLQLSSIEESLLVLGGATNTHADA